MYTSALTPCLSELRRELEEILALVARDARKDIGVHKSSPASIEPRDGNLLSERNELFDDALMVVTEFGKATAAILQMWLSIDYARAAQILSDFEAQGLVSSKGRVRHKAYELRRSRNLESRSMEFRL